MVDKPWPQPRASHIWFLLSVIWALLGWVRALALPSFLVKTKETFKLSEFQWMEAQVQANQNNYTVSKLLVDRATGSTIFEVKGVDLRENQNLPSSLQRSDWILEIVECTDGTDTLLEQLRTSDIGNDWILEYKRFEGLNLQGRRDVREYTQKTLLCAVAHAMPSAPALHPDHAKDRLFLVDIESTTQSSFLLGRVCFMGDSSETSSFVSQWARRPFQYSSAMNVDLASRIVDLLHHMGATKSDPLTLLDPTCGSGTFLALALQQGMRVKGCDVNPSCVQGSRQNLEFLLGPSEVEKRVEIRQQDSSNPWKDDKSEDTIDICVANLPWGKNSIEYFGDNLRILKSTRERIGNGKPCAFITRDSERGLFQEAGYIILAEAHVPPRDMKLPHSKKKKGAANERSGNNRCVITLAIS